jgi:hypothetical protein
MTPEEVDGDMDDGEINEEEMEELLDMMQQGMVNPKVLKKLYKALKVAEMIGVADPTIDDDYPSGEHGFHDNAKAIMRSHPGQRYAFAFSDMVLFNMFLEYVGSQRSPPMNNKEMREAPRASRDAAAAAAGLPEHCRSTWSSPAAPTRRDRRDSTPAAPTLDCRCPATRSSQASARNAREAVSCPRRCKRRRKAATPPSWRPPSSARPPTSMPSTRLGGRLS